MPLMLTFTVKDPATIRDDMLRTIRNGLLRRGVVNPNVLPGSDEYIRATAVANELAVVGANAVIKADAQMPDSADEDDLRRIAGFYGLTEQPAAGSVGPVVIVASATTTVITGAELLDAAGLRYRVSVGGIYANGATVPVEAIDTGVATNHAAGDVLRWQAAPPFCDEKVTVGAGGLVNGVDAEGIEGLRARLFARLQNPPGSGNWEHIAELAEASTGAVEKAFVFPAIHGPATVSFAVTAAPTEFSKSRVVASTTLENIVGPYVRGSLPRDYITATTVVDVPADVAFGLSLPEAPTANPPGAGGGWKNGTPWPTPNGTSSHRCAVTAVTSATTFTVDAETAPTKGVTRIAWLSPTEWKLYQALVADVSGTSGAYVITLDRPFTGITVGCLIWPDAERAQAYVDAALDAFAELGPGEKTANASALFRGFRHPTPASAWPYALGPAMLRAMSAAGEEVLDTQFLHRTDGATTLLANGGQLVPPVPAALTDAPRIFVPRHVAFYRLT